MADRRSYSTGVRSKTMTIVILVFSRRRADHLESLHSAGTAFRIRSLGAEISHQWSAHAGRHGGDFCGDRHSGRGGRFLGRQSQSIWAHLRAGPADVFAATLLSTRLADWLARPFVALGNRLAQASRRPRAVSLVNSLLLGIATGLLWAPCAGPILGLILTGAAISGPNARTTCCYLPMPRARPLLGGGIACRRAGVCVLEEIARHRRVDQAGSRRRGAARRRGNRVRMGYNRAHAFVAQRHEQPRAVADR